MYLSSDYTAKTIPVQFKSIFPPPNYQIYSNWIKFSIMAYFESNIYWITGNIPKFLVVAGIFQITDEQNDTLKLIFQVKKIFFDNLETKNIKFYDFQSNGWVKNISFGFMNRDFSISMLDFVVTKRFGVKI